MLKMGTARKNDKYFETLLEHSHDVIAMLDERGNYTYVSPQIEKLFGYTPDEFIKLRIEELIDISFMSKVGASFMAILQDPSTSQTDIFRARDKQGNWRWIESVKTNHLHNPEINAIVANFRDITESKVYSDRLVSLNESLERKVYTRTKELSLKNEELHELNRLLEMRNKELQNFAYIASHDLQEPLRKIKSFSSLLSEIMKDKMPPKARDYLKRMENAVDRMSHLIDALLSYSRITINEHPLEKVSLHDVIKDVVSDMDILVSEKHAAIHYDTKEFVHGDAFQLHLLFQNLLSNAIKYVDKKTVPNIEITAKSKANKVTIYIKDNGIGFDEKYLDRIFVMFQRLHGRTEYEGTGIGLAICQKIVERHGGTITAKSKVGKGSTFIVSLNAA